MMEIEDNNYLNLVDKLQIPYGTSPTNQSEKQKAAASSPADHHFPPSLITESCISARDIIERTQIMQLTKVIQLQMSHMVIFDILVELKRGSSYKGFDLLHALKPVRSVERKGRLFFYIIPEKSSCKIDLDWSIMQLRMENNLIFSNYLIDISNISLHFEKKILDLTSSNGFSLEKAMYIKRLRSEYLRNYCEIDEKIGKSNKHNEFLSISSYSPCFQSNSLHLSMLVHSQALLYLLGADEESISRIVLQKGRLDVFSNKSRFELQKTLMDYLLNKNFINYIDNFEITTYDDITIYCKIQHNVFEFAYPPDLQFSPDIPITDTVFISHYQIDPFQIKKLSGIRKRRDNYGECQLQLFASHDADFEYSMKSEIFLQKFYKQQLDDMNARQKVLERKKAERLSRTCKYKEIENQE